MTDYKMVQYEEPKNELSLSLTDFPPDTFNTLDKDKIIIKKEDLKTIPSLSKYISLKNILLSGTVYLKDYDLETQNNIIYLFLKEYNFISLIGNKEYFNYTKMQKLWPQNVYFNQIFQSKEAYVVDVQVIGEDGNYENQGYSFYKYNELSKYEINYIGVLFFSGYSKIEKETSFVIQEFTGFTDTSFDFNNFSMYTNLKEFFIQEFIVFLNTTKGSVFGDYSFGSGLKQMIHAKKLQKYYDYMIHDITGFINDISVLYGTFIELKKFSLEEPDNYSVKLKLEIHFNKEILEFNLVLNN